MGFEVLETIILLGSLWVFVCWIYRDYRDDSLRQRLFELRDELFDVALSGSIRFDHPAYGMVRSAINGYLLNAERISFTWLIACSIAGSKPQVREIEKRYWERWDSALASLPKDVQGKLENILERVHFGLADHLFFTSPLLWSLIVPLLVAGLLKFMSSAVKRRVRMEIVRRSRIEDLDAIGATLGGDKDPALAAA